MCLPAALIPLVVGAGLTAGGTLANYFGNQQAQHAQMDAANAERARQQGLSAKQDQAFQRSLDDTQTFGPDGQKVEADKRLATLNAALGTRSPTQDFLPGSSSADASVASSGNKIVSNEHADAAQHATALATMNGLGDALFKGNIAINREGQTINQIGSAKAGSAAVLPTELQAAAQKGSLLRGLGSLATSIGGMAIGSGLGGLAGLGSVAPISAATANILPASALSMPAALSPMTSSAMAVL